MTRVEQLPRIPIEGHVPTSLGNAEHPMRRVTRRAAGLEPGGWDDECRRVVAATFNDLAGEWATRDTPQRRAVVRDAFRRGLGAVAAPGRVDVAVELGSGTGTYSGIVAEVADSVIAADLAWEMLLSAPVGPAHRVLADGANLPVADGSVGLLAIINMFLFPQEVGRVLAAGGAVVWVNVSGPDTPIHLSVAEVVDALPFEADGVESSAGAGTWCVLRRSAAP